MITEYSILYLFYVGKSRLVKASCAVCVKIRQNLSWVILALIIGKNTGGPKIHACFGELGLFVFMLNLYLMEDRTSHGCYIVQNFLGIGKIFDIGSWV